MENQIKKTETQLAEFNEIDAALAQLKEQWEGRVFDVTTTKGMKDAKAARMEIRTQRTDLEKVRQALKAPVLERGRLIDSESKRIKEALEALEQPIDELIKKEEARKAAEKAERERKERERVENISAVLAKIDAAATASADRPSSEISKSIEWLESLDVGEAEFQEFVEIAENKVVAAVAVLRCTLAAAQNREAEAEAERLRLEEEDRARKEEAARLEAQRLEQEAREKELAEREAKQKEDERRLAREKAEAEARAAAEKEAQQEVAESLAPKQEPETTIEPAEEQALDMVEIPEVSAVQVIEALLDLIKDMQRESTMYLMEEESSENFVAKMVFMLDCPRQREAFDMAHGFIAGAKGGAQ